MSKRGSSNSSKFAGKNWSPGEKPKTFSKSIQENDNKIEDLKLRWGKICAQLNFKISGENKAKHDKIYLIYIERPKMVLEILKKYKQICKKSEVACDFNVFASNFK